VEPATQAWQVALPADDAEPAAQGEQTASAVAVQAFDGNEPEPQVVHCEQLVAPEPAAKEELLQALQGVVEPAGFEEPGKQYAHAWSLEAVPAEEM